MEFVDAGLDLSLDKAWIFWLIFGVLGVAVLGLIVGLITYNVKNAAEGSGLVGALAVALLVAGLLITLMIMTQNHDGSVKTETVERLHAYYGLEPDTFSEGDLDMVTEYKGSLYESTVVIKQDGSLVKENIGALYRGNKITVYRVSSDGTLTELPRAVDDAQ